MSDSGTVAVIGLGNMGSALAEAFVDAGREVTVWNRTWEKAAPLASRVRVAASAAEACVLADLVIVSLLDYAAVSEVLHVDEVERALRGATLVQLSTGTPSEARREAAWAAEHEIAYLDGAIMGYPRAIGTDQVVVLYAGPRAVFDEQVAVLRDLGGEPMHCGESVGFAATLDLALVQVFFGLVAVMLHGAALCDAEGYPIDAFFASLPLWVPAIMATLPETEQMVISGEFAGGNSTMVTNARAMQHVVEAAKHSSIDVNVSAALAELFRATVNGGHGEDDLPAIYATLRRLSG